MRITLGLALLCAHAFGQSTTVVDVTATTTVTATTSGGSNGACNNFYGACVVYGGYGSASYTTTMYAGNPTDTVILTLTTPTSLVTSTRTISQTTTASNSGACNNYDGACVVYGNSGVATTTVYSGSGGSSHRGQGNGDGEFGEDTNDGSDGAIGGAAPLGARTTLSLLSVVGAISGLAFWL